MIWIVSVVSVLFGVARFIMPVSGKINRADIYKDMAHLWVGFLFGLAVAGNPEVWIVGGGLTALEVVAFLIRKSS